MSDRHVTMSMLGQHGRFGNQLFQYAFLRIYARQYGLQLQTAPWVGETLFGLEPRPVTESLTPYHERPLFHPCPPAGRQLCGRDYRGYAQFHTNYYEPHKKFIRELFRPDGVLKWRMDAPLANLQLRGKTRVGIHLRRGDYGQKEFYITPTSWYVNWLRDHWDEMDYPVVFIATEDPSLAEDFAEFDPVLAPELGVDLVNMPMEKYQYLLYDKRHPEPWQMDFFPDWYLLTQCEILLMPNSTFSFTAAMMNDSLRGCWRSDLPSQSFVAVDPWCAWPMTTDQAEDYLHVPGVCLTDNPYWSY